MHNRRLFNATQGPVKTAQCSYVFPILSAQDIPHPTVANASISAMSERHRSGRFWVTAKAGVGGQKSRLTPGGGQNKLRRRGRYGPRCVMAISVANSRIRLASARMVFDCSQQASPVLVNAKSENQEFRRSSTRSVFLCWICCSHPLLGIGRWVECPCGPWNVQVGFKVRYVV
jgi:hypothetical protein